MTLLVHSWDGTLPPCTKTSMPRIVHPALSRHPPPPPLPEPAPLPGALVGILVKVIPRIRKVGFINWSLVRSPSSVPRISGSSVSN